MPQKGPSTVKRVVSEEIGDTRVLIQAVDDFRLPSDTTDRYGTATTSLDMNAERAYDQAKAVIRTMASDLGQELQALSGKAGCPQEVEMSFGMVFSAKANAWVLRVGGEVTFSVTVKWSLGSGPGAQHGKA